MTSDNPTADGIKPDRLTPFLSSQAPALATSPYGLAPRAIDLLGRSPMPHASHVLRDVSGGYADYYCRVCGLHDANTAIERPCAGTRVYACGNAGCWPVAFGRQECTRMFETQALATEHFLAQHIEEVTK